MQAHILALDLSHKGVRYSSWFVKHVSKRNSTILGVNNVYYIFALILHITNNFILNLRDIGIYYYEEIAYEYT